MQLSIVGNHALRIGSHMLSSNGLPKLLQLRPFSSLVHGRYVSGVNRTVANPQSSITKSLITNKVFMSSSAPADLLVVHVSVQVKPGTEEAFKEASLANARASAKEEGVSRFDVLQQIDDPTKFTLVEVFKTADAPALHKETEHYKTWRDTVADMMAQPRSAVKHKNLFPVMGGGWDYPEVDLE